MSAVAERTKPRLVIRVGFVWMTHRELSLVQRGEPVVCDGKLRFIYTDGHFKEARCDECSFMVAATADDVRAGWHRRDELELVAEFNRKQWWQK